MSEKMVMKLKVTEIIYFDLSNHYNIEDISGEI